MVSTKKVCRSGQCIYSVYSLLVISRNHSNTFLLIDLQKKQNFLKVEYWRKGCFSDISILTDQQVFVQYLMSGGIGPPIKFWKREGYYRNSTFRGGWLEKREVTFFRGLQFSQKKLKSEIFNDKKVYRQKYFSLS